MSHPSLSRRRRAAIAAGLAAVLGAAGAPAADAAPPTGDIVNASAPGAVPDSYIVVLEESALAADEVRGRANGLVQKYGGEIAHTYTAALRGFAVRMPEAQARKLAADPAVAYVEQDSVVTLDATQSPTPSWGLDRIDQRALPANSSYTYPTTASGVNAYVVDTGIRTTHTDFGGRAVHGRDTVDNDADATDCNGHGTHVAGTVGGTAYGVAKGVTLIGVRVLDCAGSGTDAGVIAGIDWVTADHAAGEKAVANMSLGGDFSQALNDATNRAIADGVTFVVAAGNETADACTTSPASTPNAVTVGATTSTDARASYSNYGTCLDVFAPGSSITSTWYTSNTATNSISGTSMASPHVAGAAALVLAANPSFTPAQVAAKIVADATTGVVTGGGTGSPNRLLYVGAATTPSPTPTPTAPPVAGCSAAAGTDVAVKDNATVESPVTISGCTGTATQAVVDVDITHTYRGDLEVSLVAPDGSAYVLLDNAGGSADNVDQAFTVDVSETANGTWRLRVTDTATGDTGTLTNWSLSLTAGTAGSCSGGNATDYAVPDGGTVSSPVTIAGCAGTKVSAVVDVDITHTYRGDLVVSLVAPDGTVYPLLSRSGGSADNVDQTFTVNLSSETANGTWNLRVQDAAASDTGTLTGWSLTL